MNTDVRPVCVGVNCPIDGDGPALTEATTDGVLVGNSLEDQAKRQINMLRYNVHFLLVDFSQTRTLDRLKPLLVSSSYQFKNISVNISGKSHRLGS